MLKKFCLLFSLSFFAAMQAQTSSELGVWLDHLPYSQGVDVEDHDGIAYVATAQGLFFYNNREKTIDRLSKVNGLSDIGITAIDYSPEYSLLMVGYENGNIDIVEGEQVTNIPSIRQSGNYTGLKRINHIEMKGDVAYICTDFGIVTFDLFQRIVLETLIIGEGGEILGVDDLTLSEDSIFAATEEGLFKAAVSSQLAVFLNWHRDTLLPGRINQVAYFNDQLYANRITQPTMDSVFYREGGQWKYADHIVFMGSIRQLREDKGWLLVTNGFSSQAYNNEGQMVFNLQGAQFDYPDFSPVAASLGIDPNVYWVVDARQGLFQGYKYEGSNYTDHIEPNAPATARVLEMYHNGERLYVAPGGIIDVWAPIYNNDGYFVLEDYFWTNHPNTEFGGYQDIVAVITDPEDPDHAYLSSYGNGIIEMRDGEFIRLINAETTEGAMMPISQQDNNHRVGGFSPDPEGNIWFSNSITDEPLGVLRPDGTVETFSLGSSANSSTGVKNIMYTSQDQIWLQTRNEGIVVAFFENGQLKSRVLSSTEGSGNLPTETVLCFAEDQDGEIWIGTNEGMAVLYSPQNITEPNRNYDANPIIIDEDQDSSGERVLGSEVINDIEVDGSNKKWFATGTAGVFYTSENGKQQLRHFTSENSPLPSNNVQAIEIDQTTGMVYFATDRGMVSYQGSATEGVTSHTDVFAYPNPVEPGYEGPILIRGLVTNAQVKITDIEGNIVYETVAEGGQAIWSGRNHAGRRAKSGVYLAYITNDMGSATAVTKILIVN